MNYLRPISQIILAAFLLVVSGAPSRAGNARSQRPNVVFLYADDLGYGDLACYGSPVAQTPRLDRLARDGTRFIQFYVSNCVCSPTRASAITGHFPSRHRIFSHIAFFEMNR